MARAGKVRYIGASFHVGLAVLEGAVHRVGEARLGEAGDHGSAHYNLLSIAKKSGRCSSCAWI